MMLKMRRQNWWWWHLQRFNKDTESRESPPFNDHRCKSIHELLIWRANVAGFLWAWSRRSDRLMEPTNDLSRSSVIVWLQTAREDVKCSLTGYPMLTHTVKRTTVHHILITATPLKHLEVWRCVGEERQEEKNGAFVDIRSHNEQSAFKM